MKVAVVGAGAGAAGLALGAAFARAVCAVTVCGGTPIQAITVTDGGVTETAPVRSASSPVSIVGHRIVVVAVKAQNTGDVGHWIRAAAGPQTTVLVAQNGIEHLERVAPYAGDSAVVPAAVYMAIERPEPGRAVVRGTAAVDLIVSADAAAVAVAGLLRAGGLRVETAADFRTAAWVKVLANVAANSVTVLTGRGMEVFRDPAVARYAVRVVREAAEVARAGSVSIPADQPERTVAMLQGLPVGVLLVVDVMTADVFKTMARFADGAEEPCRFVILRSSRTAYPQRDSPNARLKCFECWPMASTAGGAEKVLNPERRCGSPVTFRELPTPG